MPEIPTTLPTLDEVIGAATSTQMSAIVDYYLRQMREDALNVHTVHAETEGMEQLEVFIALVEALKARGAQFVRLGEVAAQLALIELPVCEVKRTTLPGRAGWVSAQGPAAV